MVVTTTHLSDWLEPSVSELCGVCASKPYSHRREVTVKGEQIDALSDMGADVVVLRGGLIPVHSFSGIYELRFSFRGPDAEN